MLRSVGTPESEHPSSSITVLKMHRYLYGHLLVHRRVGSVWHRTDVLPRPYRGAVHSRIERLDGVARYTPPWRYCRARQMYRTYSGQPATRPARGPWLQTAFDARETRPAVPSHPGRE